MLSLVLPLEENKILLSARVLFGLSEATGELRENPSDTRTQKSLWPGIKPVTFSL